MTCGLLFAASGARDAKADIAPPPGYQWVHSEVVVTNVDAFPEHVFVAFTCFPGYAHVMQQYCVIREGDTLRPQLEVLFALPAAAVETKEGVLLEEDRQAGRRTPLLLLEPRIRDERRFFESDARVVRPGFALAPAWMNKMPQNVGVRSAHYTVRIEGVGPEGVRARFTRARYVCRSGPTVELEWGLDQKRPPVPTCAVTDDHGQWIGAFDGGKPAPGATAPPWTERDRERGPLRAPGHAIWVGLLLSSLSLLGLGLLVRRAHDKPG